MDDLEKSNQSKSLIVKKPPGTPGRRPIDPKGRTLHVGYRSSQIQKNQLIDIASDLGYKNVSDLIRHIVQGWINNYNRTDGARREKK